MSKRWVRLYFYRATPTSPSASKLALVRTALEHHTGYYDLLTPCICQYIPRVKYREVLCIAQKSDQLLSRKPAIYNHLNAIYFSEFRCHVVHPHRQFSLSAQCTSSCTSIPTFSQGTHHEFRYPTYIPGLCLRFHLITWISKDQGTIASFSSCNFAYALQY